MSVTSRWDLLMWIVTLRKRYVTRAFSSNSTTLVNSDEILIHVLVLISFIFRKANYVWNLITFFTNTGAVPCRHTWGRCSVLLMEHWATRRRLTYRLKKKARARIRDGWLVVDAMTLMEELLKHIRRSNKHKSRRKIVKWTQKRGILTTTMKCAKCNRRMHLVKCHVKDGLWW